MNATEGCRSGEAVGVALCVASGLLGEARVSSLTGCGSSPLDVTVGATIVERLSSWPPTGMPSGRGFGTSSPVRVSLGDIAVPAKQHAGRIGTWQVLRSVPGPFGGPRLPAGGHRSTPTPLIPLPRDTNHEAMLRVVARTVEVT